jgi:hypothetical protein
MQVCNTAMTLKVKTQMKDRLPILHTPPCNTADCVKILLWSKTAYKGNSVYRFIVKRGHSLFISQHATQQIILFLSRFKSITQCSYYRYGDVTTTTCFDLFRSSSSNLNLSKTTIVTYVASILKLKKLKIQIVKNLELLKT